MEIESEEEYRKALKRPEIIFDAPIGTPESDEAYIFVAAIEVYENKHYPIS